MSDSKEKPSDATIKMVAGAEKPAVTFGYQPKVEILEKGYQPKAATAPPANPEPPKAKSPILHPAAKSAPAPKS